MIMMFSLFRIKKTVIIIIVYSLMELPDKIITDENKRVRMYREQRLCVQKFKLRVY